MYRLFLTGVIRIISGIILLVCSCVVFILNGIFLNSTSCGGLLKELRILFPCMKILIYIYPVF